MHCHSEQIALATDRPIQIIDVTSHVAGVVQRSAVRHGLAVVGTRHTTSAIRINERCEHLVTDLERFFARLVPKDGGYQHDLHCTDGRPNARSHLLSWLMGASENVGVSAGVLQLGRWQSLFFVELDGPRPDRAVTVTVIGE